MTIDKTVLNKHAYVNIIIRTRDCIPRWGDGRRGALDNSMLADIVRDICLRQLSVWLTAEDDGVIRHLFSLIEQA